MSFYHLRAGERKAISVAVQTPEGRLTVSRMLVDFLKDLSDSTDPDFERSFIVGREMRSAWPEAFSQELVDHIQKSYSGRVTSALIEGFKSLETGLTDYNAFSRPPSLYRLNSVLTLLKNGGVSTASRAARHFMGEHLSYTERTGFSQFLTQSTVRLAAALVKRAAYEKFEGGALAQTFVRDALKWEPWNSRLWELWSESYIAQGGVEPAELILWEATRRFPDNPAIMDRLIRLVGRQPTRRPEALALAQGALHRFPANTHLENATAVALIHAGAPDEALDLIVASLKRNRMNDPNITVLGSAICALVAKRKEFDLDLVERLSKLPSDALLLGKTGRALNQQGLDIRWIVAYYRFALSLRPENVFLKVRLAASLLRLGASHAIIEAKDILRGVLEDDPENTNASELLIRAEQTSVSDDHGSYLAPEAEADIADLGVSKELPEEGVIVLDVEGPSEAPWPDLPDVVERFGRARRLRSRLEAANDNIRSAAFDELREFFRHDPTFAYAQLLAVRQGVWDNQSNVSKTFAAAFESAIVERDVEQLRLLEQDYPRWQALTLVAKAIFGDADAIASLHHVAEPGQVRTELESRAASLIEASGSSSRTELGLTAVSPDIIVRLRELNEWALGEAMPLAA